MPEERIDLSSGLTTLMEKEDLLAFFRFQVGSEAGGVDGFCKVTVPIKGTSHLRYVTLSFLSDTPDDTPRADARYWMNEVQIEQLKSRVPEIQDVIVSPSLRFEALEILRQLDIYLVENSSPTPAFLEHRLIPALVEITGIKVFELNFWREPGQRAAAMHGVGSPSSGEDKFPKPTLAERIRSWLGKSR